MQGKRFRDDGGSASRCSMCTPERAWPSTVPARWRRRMWSRGCSGCARTVMRRGMSKALMVRHSVHNGWRPGGLRSLSSPTLLPLGVRGRTASPERMASQKWLQYQLVLCVC